MLSGRKALVVGIDDYPNAPLTCCVNDAKSISKVLERNEYDKSINFDVRTCYNIKTKEELRNEIERLFEGNSDVALFYFSGHGCDEDGTGFLVTPDYCKGGMGVNMNDVMKFVSKSKCKNKIVIIDSCHSGLIGSNSLHCEETTITEGTTILTACDIGENALESNGHGLFTRLMLSALNGEAADLMGHVTAGGLYAYIDRSLGPWEQRPVFKTNISSFVPIVRTKPTISPDELRLGTSLFDGPDAEVKLNPSFEFTNDPDYPHNFVEPYAIEENVRKLKLLQKMESVGLVAPVGEKHMYFAAMNSKSCKLTQLGKYYHRLCTENRI